MNQQLPGYDDEIDLFELVENLWNQKLFIAVISAVSVTLGGVYTFIAPERWTAEVRLSFPKSTAINSLNPPELAVFKEQIQVNDAEENQSITELNKIAPEITPEQIMTDFLAELRSVQTLVAFDDSTDKSLFQFETTPSLEKKVAAASGFLESNLTAIAPGRDETHFSVTLTLDDPDSVARVLSDYIEFVNAKVIDHRGRDLELGIRRAIQTNEFEIKRAERAYVRRLEEDLAVLEEALRIARVSGIRENQSGLFVGREDNRLTEASGLYLRGEKLLVAEIQALKARMETASLIPDVRDLQAENDLLNNIQIDTTDALAYTLEKPATAPMGRDSPKTQLILALALVLGGMIGVVTALVRTAIRNRQAKVAA